MTKTYFNPRLDQLEATEAQMSLTPDDLYKEFRLKGFEYGPSFKLLQGAALESKLLSLNDTLCSKSFMNCDVQYFALKTVLSRLFLNWAFAALHTFQVIYMLFSHINHTAPGFIT